jgi:HlyD family secretion protein
MKIKVLCAITIAISLAIIAIVRYWYATEQGSGSDLIPSTIASASSAKQNTVSALGRLEPASRVIRVAAPSGNEGNRLESLQVQEGDDVAKGNVLGYMDTYTRRLAAKRQEEARLATAMAKLDQVLQGNKQGDIEAARATVESAQHDLATKEKELRRAEQLKPNKAISDAEVDEYRLAHERSVATLRQTKAQLAAISEVRSVDVALAESEVRLAQSAVEFAKANVDATVIVAPCAGRILRIHTRPGEQISTEGLLDLGRVDQMQVVAEVFEGDIPELKPGDRAVVTIDTNGHVLQGHVREIGHIVARKAVLTNDPVSDTDARIVEVRINLEQSRPAWLERMSNARVKVRIGTDQVTTSSKAALATNSMAAENCDDVK